MKAIYQILIFETKIRSYQEEIDDILINSEKIDFNILINHSYFFQWMIINNQKLPYKFISNNLPFFLPKKIIISQNQILPKHTYI